MKISFSTLGCPGWPWEDMLVAAKDLGFDGIEVRGVENEIYVPKIKPFLDSNIEATSTRLKSLNLEIPCLTSSCYLFNKTKTDYYVNEGKEYIDTASKLGCPYVRVLGDAEPEPGKDIDFDFTAKNIAVLAEYAESKNIKVLIETNGIFASSELMLKLVNAVNSKGLGVLWDIHHPYRFMNESVSQTYNALRDYILHVHIKDSLVENGTVRYKMLGYGDIPVKEALKVLKDNQYAGYVSLEWVKRWCTDLEEPGVVFSHFINYIKNVLK